MKMLEDIKKKGNKIYNRANKSIDEFENPLDKINDKITEKINDKIQKSTSQNGGEKSRKKLLKKNIKTKKVRFY
jgi:hypothetical protein